MRLLGYYNYTVILTYIGMAAGTVGILSAMEHKCGSSVICLMIAGLCDMFDGTVASTKERSTQEKNFGIQIDSLSDLICFGVLPAVLTCTLSDGNGIVKLIAVLYVLCALVRLAYYNVDEQERQKKEAGCRKTYLGMPVTLSALFFPIVYVMTGRWQDLRMAALASLLIIMGILYILPFQLKKPQIIGNACRNRL